MKKYKITSGEELSLIFYELFMYFWVWSYECFITLGDFTTLNLIGDFLKVGGSIISASLPSSTCVWDFIYFLNNSVGPLSLRIVKLSTLKREMSLLAYFKVSIFEEFFAYSYTVWSVPGEIIEPS